MAGALNVAAANVDPYNAFWNIEREELKDVASLGEGAFGTHIYIYKRSPHPLLNTFKP